MLEGVKSKIHKENPVDSQQETLTEPLGNKEKYRDL